MLFLFLFAVVLFIRFQRRKGDGLHGLPCQGQGNAFAHGRIVADHTDVIVDVHRGKGHVFVFFFFFFFEDECRCGGLLLLVLPVVKVQGRTIGGKALLEQGPAIAVTGFEMTLVAVVVAVIAVVAKVKVFERPRVEIEKGRVFHHEQC